MQLDNRSRDILRTLFRGKSEICATKKRNYETPKSYEKDSQTVLDGVPENVPLVWNAEIPVVCQKSAFFWKSLKIDIHEKSMKN